MDWGQMSGWKPTRYVSQVLRMPPDVPLAAMDLAVGLLLIVGGDGRSHALAFASAKALAPIQFWGLLFVLVGVALFIALRWSEHQFFVNVTRILGPTLCVMWAVMYLVSGLSKPGASFIGVPPYLYLAFRHHFAPIKPMGR